MLYSWAQFMVDAQLQKKANTALQTWVLFPPMT